MTKVSHSGFYLGIVIVQCDEFIHDSYFLYCYTKLNIYSFHFTITCFSVMVHYIYLFVGKWSSLFKLAYVVKLKLVCGVSSLFIMRRRTGVRKNILVAVTPPTFPLEFLHSLESK